MSRLLVPSCYFCFLRVFVCSCTGGDSQLTPLDCALLIVKYEGEYNNVG